MEVFADGFQPREVQFAIVEQNPTLLNITLFAENTQQRIELPTNNLETSESKLDELEDKLDAEVNAEEESDYILGFIPNPIAKIQRDIKKNVDSVLSKIPLIGWNTPTF